MIRRVLICFVWLTSVSFLNAQVRFVASSDAKQIVAGQFFSVTFSLENASGEEFTPPSFKDFEVAGGPSTSTSISIINGSRKQSKSYTYNLTTNKVGRYNIGSAVMHVNGQTYRTQPISIEVVKGRSQSVSGNEPFLVVAEVDHAQGYIGQQITLKYVLYTNQDVRSYNFSSLPSFDGFFAQELHNYRGRTEQVVKDGVQYVSKVIKVVALFPQQKGTFLIDPARATIGISDGRRNNSFFFNTRLKQYQVNSNELAITIIDLPEDAPVSFSGAVGDFYMGSAVDKQTITQDDAVTLTLQVKGYGDGKFIEAPTQPYSHLFDIYDPNLLSEKSNIVDDRIEVFKTYEYLMIPKKTGTISFRPELSFYHLDSNKYETIYGQLYRINVLKGTGREQLDLVREEVSLPLPPHLDSLRGINDYFAFSSVHLGTNAVLIFGLFGLLLYRRHLDKEEAIDPAVKRYKKAQKVAQQKLFLAKEELDSGNVTAYYTQLRRTLQEYLSDKCNLPSSQLSKQHISDLFEKYGLETHQERVLAVMQKGERALYASVSPGAEIADYDTILNTISEIELQIS
jgi:hypothetical protein